MKGWLAGIFGEAYAQAAFWTLALLVLAAAILIFLQVVRRLGFGSLVPRDRSGQPRLAVVDATPVDNHRRLVLVRRDNIEHLILIGGPTDVVVESGIEPVHDQRPREQVPPQRPAIVGHPSAARDRPGPAQPQPAVSSRAPEPMPERGPSQDTAPPVHISEARRAPADRPSGTVRAEAAAAPRDVPRPPTMRDTHAPTVSVASAGGAALRAVPTPQRSTPPITDSAEELALNDLSEAINEVMNSVKGEADTSLEDEMSRLLEDLSDDRQSGGR